MPRSGDGRTWGLVSVNFFQNGEIGYTPHRHEARNGSPQFQDHLLLYFTGFSRTASEIAREQIDAHQTTAG